MTTKKTDGADGATTNDTATTPTAAADKPHYATRDFKDAGSERQFVKDGKPLTDVTPGELANYVAAGLASTDKPEITAA